MPHRHTERHKTEHIGWLRAAVLGANDGIVSTASLIIGVAAANGGKEAVLVAGVAGLVAGAMSMVAGEYVSVHSQADTEKADTERERAEIEADQQARRTTRDLCRIGEYPQHLRESQRDQREIGSPQPSAKHHGANRVPQHRRRRDAKGHGRIGIHAKTLLQNGADISAHAEKRRMAKGILPTITAEQIPPLRGNRQDQRKDQEIQHNIAGDE